MTTIGIDPGGHGGLFISNGFSLTYKAAQRYSNAEFDYLFDATREVWIEEVDGRPGDKAHDAFALGQTYGFWHAVLTSRRISPKYVAPQIWQVRFARRFGERWMPTDYDKRKRFVYDKINTIIPATLEMADAAAIAWLAEQGAI